MDSFSSFYSVSYKPGQVIFEEGERGTAVYLIKEGEVEITKVIDGKTIKIATMTNNNVFGEMAFLDKQPRSGTATAVADTVCYRIDSFDFKGRVDKLDPFMKALFRVMAGHIRAMNERVAKLEAKYGPLEEE